MSWEQQSGSQRMASREIDGGTKITMRFGSVVVPATLNGTTTARAFARTLPRTIRVSNYGTDHCGIMEELPYDKADVHKGWLDGDIDYATDGPWFVVFFDGEDRSQNNDYQVNIGRIDCALSVVAGITGTTEIRIELA